MSNEGGSFHCSDLVLKYQQIFDTSLILIEYGKCYRHTISTSFGNDAIVNTTPMLLVLINFVCIHNMAENCAICNSLPLCLYMLLLNLNWSIFVMPGCKLLRAMRKRPSSPKHQLVDALHRQKVHVAISRQ